MEINTAAGEEWRPIPNIPGYFVSNFGRIKNSAKEVTDRNGNVRHFKQKIVSVFMSSSGKLAFFVGLPNENPSQRLVSVAVANAFLANPKRMSRVKHLDSDPWNCDATNLAWGCRPKGWAD